MRRNCQNHKYLQITVIWVSVCFVVYSDVASCTNVTVRTQAENNRNASVWYRAPEGYREIQGCWCLPSCLTALSVAHW